MRNHSIIACAHCGTPFQAYASERRIFCSRQCAYAAISARTPDRCCVQCGGIFRSSKTRRFCGRDCLIASRFDRRQPPEIRLWDHVDKTATCWLWTGAVTDLGYGYLTEGGRRGNHQLAHRVAWVEATGLPIPSGRDICHVCDVTNCVRNDGIGVYVLDGIEYPRRGHLFLGTRAANNADKVMKGRQARGETHGYRVHPELVKHGIQNTRSKLTWDQVDEIRERWASERVTQLAMSREYGLSPGHLNEIITGKRWKFRLLSERPGKAS